MPASCVAIKTVVPSRLIRSSNFIMPTEVAGSRFPVGSSAIKIGGRLTYARAIATRCCSPPEISEGKRSPLSSKPTSSRTSGTSRFISFCEYPSTCNVKATFSVIVLFGSKRKSWKTVPTERRSSGTLCFASVPRSFPATWIEPAVGRSSRRTNRKKVDLPEPESPTRNTNSPFTISRFTESRAGRS